jgi:hypothetical protein
MRSATAASGAIPLSKWLVFICPFLAGFECLLTRSGAKLNPALIRFDSARFQRMPTTSTVREEQPAPQLLPISSPVHFSLTSAPSQGSIARHHRIGRFFFHRSAPEGRRLSCGLFSLRCSLWTAWLHRRHRRNWSGGGIVRIQYLG